MVPTLCVIIPTAGRQSLRRTLDSIAPQVLAGDGCIVVGDVFDGPLPQTEAICREYDFVRYVEYAWTGHMFGHPQFEYGQSLVTQDWIVGQDDDDIFTADAFAAIRAAIAYAEEPRPLLFRFKSYFDGLVFWHTPGPEWVRPGHIGGHCLCLPNVAGKIGLRARDGTYRYESDYDWVADTLKKWEPVEPLWCNHVISIARPGD